MNGNAYQNIFFNISFPVILGISLLSTFLSIAKAYLFFFILSSKYNYATNAPAVAPKTATPIPVCNDKLNTLIVRKLPSTIINTLTICSTI